MRAKITMDLIEATNKGVISLELFEDLFFNGFEEVVIFKVDNLLLQTAFAGRDNKYIRIKTKGGKL